MKSSKTMHDIALNAALRRPPVIKDQMIGYALSADDLNRLFFEHKFSGRTQTRDRYIAEWCLYGAAIKTEDEQTIFFPCRDRRSYLQQESKRYAPLKLEVLA